MSVTDETPGKAGKTKVDAAEPTERGGAYKSQDLADAGEATPGVNKFERIKAEKDGLLLKQELDYLAKIGWEAIEEADRDFRLRVLGLFYRTVTPGKFMLRMRLANGVITSGQMRVLAEIVQYYGDESNADITTRQNIQLRGIRIEDVPDIFAKLEQVGLTSVQSGVDNVRNITGSPLSGIDPDELIDTRGLCRMVQDMITNIRLYAQDMFDLARIAEVYGTGEIRFTVEQNLIIPNIPNSRLEALLQEPILQHFSINPDNLMRSLVSCTGSQFCGFALIETKNRALATVKALAAELEVPQPVRIHWTGCPNSCGQPQVADIGLMGTKGRKNGQVVEAVDIWMEGKVGHEAELGKRVTKGIPCVDLLPVLRDLLIEKFGATPKPSDETEYFIPPELVGQ